MKQLCASLDRLRPMAPLVLRAADYQASHLMETAVGYELLLDPDQRLYDALSLRRFPWWRMLDHAVAATTRT